MGTAMIPRSVHHIFNFDYRYFADDPSEWLALNESNWPLGAITRGKWAGVTRIHIIGETDLRIGKLAVHRGLVSGPSSTRYGHDISPNLLRLVHGLSTQDVVFLHEAGWPAGQLVGATNPSVPLVGVYHGGGAGGNEHRIRRYNRHLVLRQHVANELIDLGVLPERIAVVTPSVDDAFFDVRRTVKGSDDIVVGFVGRPYEPKGISEAVNGVKMLGHRGVPARLDIVGAKLAEDQGVVDAIAADLLSSGARVRVLGRVPNRELPGIMSAWQVLAFPSLQEGFGRTVVEACAAGVMTVTVRGVIPDRIVDQRSVVSVAREDFAEAVAVAALASEPVDLPDFVHRHDQGAEEFDREIGLLPPPVAIPRESVDWRSVGWAVRDSMRETRLVRRIRRGLTLPPSRKSSGKGPT